MVKQYLILFPLPLINFACEEPCPNLHPDSLFKDPFLEACKELGQSNIIVEFSILNRKYFSNNVVQFLFPSGWNWGVGFLRGFRYSPKVEEPNVLVLSVAH